MLNIVITYNNSNTINDIYNYVKHLNNINKNIQLEIHIIIICFNMDSFATNSYNIENNEIIKKNEIMDKIKVMVYNYKCDYNDLVQNEIVEKCVYELILYTNLNTYLVEPFLEYIALNKIDDNCFIRTNVIELKKLVNEFNENYTNNIFNVISENVKYICNERSKQDLDKNSFIELFNVNKNIINISNDNIKTHNIYYLNNSNNFILINKKILSQIGFNITNTNPNYTNQFLILNLINNNLNMIKLPIILSVYKLETDIVIPLLDTEIEFKVSNEYNKTINYRIYDIINNTEKSYIRNHIKQLHGVHSNDLANINKLLIEEKNLLIEEKNLLIEENTLLKDKISEYDIKLSEIEHLKNILNNKYIVLEDKYEHLKEKKHNCEKNDDIIDYKKEYITKLCILNSNINELIITEKNSLFE